METIMHDKTSDRLLRKLMTTDAKLFTGRKDNRSISIYKIQRDIDIELATEIYDALEYVKNSEYVSGK